MMNNSIRFATGVENFSELIECGAYYVDKTSYLMELFMGYDNVKAPLFIRPRRFGKTLNMSMIKAFCELNYQNPGDKSFQERLFLDNGRNFAVSGDAYRDLRERIMGEFPVISISFKSVAGSTYLEALEAMLEIVADLYRRFYFLTQSNKLLEIEKEAFEEDYAFCRYETRNLFQRDVQFRARQIACNFLPNLAALLYAEYGRRVLILIDEYDVPLQKAVVSEEPYYETMLAIMKQICIRTFKQQPDPWLYKGIVTGCLKVAHQSIFTDANNFTVYGMDDNPYAGFFGFTEEETEELLRSCDLFSHEKDVRKWYDGYRFGHERIFCPWSVVRFCAAARAENARSDMTPQAYWVNSSGNDILWLYLSQAVRKDLRPEIARIEELLNGSSQRISLAEFTTYPDVEKNMTFDRFMTMLLHTGYVTFTDSSPLHDLVELRIPNLEVCKSFELKLDVLYSLENPVWVKKAETFLTYLLRNDCLAAQDLLKELLGEFITLRDTGNEFFYHGFLQGILALVVGTHQIEMKSECESGDGYTDLTLHQRKTRKAVILEVKKSINDEYAREKAASDACEQIVKRGYAQKFLKEHCKEIFGIGIGFGGKSCVMISLGNLASLPDR